MNKVEWSQRARKQLRRIDRQYQKNIVLAVGTLAHWPDCRNVKALQGRSGYRLRVGQYRIIFNVRQALRIIRIEEVKKRNGHTY